MGSPVLHPGIGFGLQDSPRTDLTIYPGTKEQPDHIPGHVHHLRPKKKRTRYDHGSKVNPPKRRTIPILAVYAFRLHLSYSSTHSGRLTEQPERGNHGDPPPTPPLSGGKRA